MEGEPHYMFKRTKQPGRCPVRFCRRASRSGGGQSCHRLCNTHRSRLWQMQNPERAAYNRLKHHAHERGKVFAITFDQFKTVVGMQDYIDGSGKQRYMLTLDRIENHRGYEPDNIQVLTNGENVAKGNAERRNRYVREKIDAREEEPF